MLLAHGSGVVVRGVVGFVVITGRVTLGVLTVVLVVVTVDAVGIGVTVVVALHIGGISAHWSCETTSRAYLGRRRSRTLVEVAGAGLVTSLT